MGNLTGQIIDAHGVFLRGATRRHIAPSATSLFLRFPNPSIYQSLCCPLVFAVQESFFFNVRTRCVQRQLEDNNVYEAGVCTRHVRCVNASASQKDHRLAER